MVAIVAALPSVRVFGVLVALIAATHLFSSAFMGLCGITIAAAVCVAPGRSFDVAATFGAWALTAVMFGFSGAACLILAQSIVAAGCMLVPRGDRENAALLLFTAGAALLVSGHAVLAPLFGFSGDLLAELVGISAIGAPALALGRIAGLEIGKERFETLRLWMLAPQYLALIAGASLGGLPGAAAGLAFGTLACPVVALCSAPGTLVRRGPALGVLAAGLVAALAATAAAGTPWLTLLAGGAAGLAALRIHAPGMATALADEIRPVAVLFRDSRDRDRPFELEPRIIKADAALRAGRVGLGDHVGDLGVVLEREEAMRETGREIEKLPLR